MPGVRSRRFGAQRRFDRRQRGFGLGAVGTAGLRHIGTTAAALAAERRRGDAHEIDRAMARDKIGGDGDDDARLAVFGQRDDRDDARADALLGLVGHAISDPSSRRR